MIWLLRCRSAIRLLASLTSLDTTCRTLLLLAAALQLGACSSFNDGFARIDSQLLAGDLAAARASHDTLAYPPRDRALQLLNRAMLLRFGGDLRASNVALESAKGIIDELSKLSLAEQATSLLTNDELRAYDGSVHERIYLQLIKAINFLQLGDFYAARVEVLQLDVLMRALADSEKSAVERAAPFAYYLSGLIYDALDQPSDAMIAYRQAAEAYRQQRGAAALPAALADDLLRLSGRLGLDEENETYRQAFDRPLPLAVPAAGEGELVLLVFDGLAPALRENSVAWADPLSGRLLRISLPAAAYRRLATTPPKLRIAARSLSGESLSGESVNGELVDDLDRLVRADLDARMPVLAARTIARQALKQGAATAVSKAAQRKVDNSGEQLAAGVLSIGMQFAAVLSERADTRNWSTLPGRVWLIRQPLAAGTHRPQVEFAGRTQTLPDVRIKAGEKTFIAWHPLGPGGVMTSVH